jgi:hypothetical protein
LPHTQLSGLFGCHRVPAQLLSGKIGTAILEIGIIFRHKTKTINPEAIFVPDLVIEYAIREPSETAIIVLVKAHKRLLPIYLNTGRRLKRRKKFSTDNTDGKNFGGIEITSVFVLNDELIK